MNWEEAKIELDKGNTIAREGVDYRFARSSKNNRCVLGFMKDRNKVYDWFIDKHMLEHTDYIVDNSQNELFDDVFKSMK
jgi:hypothetical protein